MCRSQGLDAESKTARFESEDGAEVTTGFDLLVGADGANSVVRETLAGQGKISFTRVNSPSRPVSRPLRMYTCFLDSGSLTERVYDWPHALRLCFLIAPFIGVSALLKR